MPSSIFGSLFVPFERMFGMERLLLFDTTSINLFGSGALIVAFFRGVLENFDHLCHMDLIVDFLFKFRAFLANGLSIHMQPYVVILFWADDLLKTIKLKISMQGEHLASWKALESPGVEFPLLEWNPNFILFGIPSSRQLFVELKSSILSTIMTPLSTNPAASLLRSNVIKPSRIIAPVVEFPLVTVALASDIRKATHCTVQQALREWFLWRYPKLKDVLQFLLKTLPEVIFQEILPLPADVKADGMELKMFLKNVFHARFFSRFWYQS